MLGLKLNHISKRGSWSNGEHGVGYHRALIYHTELTQLVRPPGSSVKHMKYHLRWSPVREQIKTLSALLVLCEGNPLVISFSPLIRPVMHSFEVFFVVSLIKLLKIVALSVIWDAFTLICDNLSDLLVSVYWHSSAAPQKLIRNK